MAHPHWPFFDLRITTPRLELRYPDDDLLVALAAVAAAGIHPPDRMPFNEPWTRAASPALERGALQHWWTQRASLSAASWTLDLAVLADGRPVGVQSVFSQSFAVRRSFETGSWLGALHQGRGIGTEMRAAALHLGFEGLGAQVAETGAFSDNVASQAVTGKLGYQPNGVHVRDRDGATATMLLYRLTRDEWERRRRDDITIHGLEPCLPLLGVAPADAGDERRDGRR